MNMISELFSTTIIQALGWALIHSLWQGGILLICLYLLLSLLRNQSAHFRYILSVGTLSVFVLVAISTYFYEYNQLSLQEKQPALNEASLSTNKTIVFNFLATNNTETTYSNWIDQLLFFIKPYLSFMVILWIAGVVLFTIRLSGGYLLLNKKIRLMMGTGNDQLQELVDKMVNQLGISKKIKALEVDFIKVPSVFGHLKPIILLPIGMVNQLSMDQVEMILLHELAHIKRHDFLVNIMQSILEILFFFNPAIWIISREVRQERENACDDFIVKNNHQVIPYIKTLAQLNSRAAVAYQISPGILGNGKNQLLKRMQRLIKIENHSFQNYSGHRLVTAILVVIVSILFLGWKEMKMPVQSSGKVAESGFLTSQNQFPEAITGASYLLSDTTDLEVRLQQEKTIKEQEAKIQRLKLQIEKMNKANQKIREEREKFGSRHEDEIFDDEEVDVDIQREVNVDVDMDRDVDVHIDVDEYEHSSDQADGIRETAYQELLQHNQHYRNEQTRRIKEVWQQYLEQIKNPRTELYELLERHENDKRQGQFDDFDKVDQFLKERLEVFEKKMVEMNNSLNDLLVKPMPPTSPDNIFANDHFLEPLKETLESANLQLEMAKKELSLFSADMKVFEKMIVKELKNDHIITQKYRGNIRIKNKNEKMIINGNNISADLKEKYLELIQKYLNVNLEEFEGESSIHFQMD